MMPWGGKQLVRCGIGVLCLAVITYSDIRSWFTYAYITYGLSLFLLIAVEFMGFVGMGAQRWIGFGAFQLQPSELMRLSLILALSKYYHPLSLQEIIQSKHLWIPLAMIVFPVLLIMRQPDLGSAMMLIMAGLSVMWVASVPFRFFAFGLGAVVTTLPIIWKLLHEYQKKRVITFLNPESDPLHAGYHVLQSKIALGAGGLTGHGFLKGTQSHLNFLPEKHTDFILALLGEEFGFAGILIIVILYGLWIYANNSMALGKFAFGRYVITGMTTTVFLYAFINIGMVSGILPVVGIPLPLISYGGTALVTLLMSQGLVLSAHRYNDKRMMR